MTLFRNTESQDEFQLRMSFIFGFLVVGNIVDNISTPKNFAIILQVSLSISWICTGFMLYFVAIDGHRCPKNFHTIHIGALSQICASGIILINILQVYNWASKRYIQLLLIIYFLQQFIGYMTPLYYEPSCDWAAHPFWYWISSAFMLGLAVLDYWVFYFNPLQNNIFLDQEEKNKRRTDRSRSYIGSAVSRRSSFSDIAF